MGIGAIQLSRQNVRFLIVDDDESIHLYLQSVLSSYAQCDSAISGEAGVEMFDQAHAEGSPYDVVFMDILMPGMSGHQTAEIMRASERKRKVGVMDRFKLVMITSLVDDTNVSKAFFSTHASCYIVKPLDRNRVLDELEQNLIIEQ